MNNILIITSGNDNRGTDQSFIQSINDIKEKYLRDMVIACINGTEYEYTINKISYWASDGMCGCDSGGYIFNRIGYTEFKFPMTVEHIVDFTIE